MYKWESRMCTVETERISMMSIRGSTGSSVRTEAEETAEPQACNVWDCVLCKLELRAKKQLSFDHVMQKTVRSL
jgi:hypothetical protein